MELNLKFKSVEEGLPSKYGEYLFVTKVHGLVRGYWWEHTRHYKKPSCGIAVTNSNHYKGAQFTMWCEIPEDLK